ncbi:MAG: low affinity iron permease family protein [Betaproteobacteria bacterium]|nr:low affinity iron permease family protein [Betaproteobacteria bacterium]
MAAAVILVWICTGPLFGFGDTWQLVINTGTTIVTFLMVFLIQKTLDQPAGKMSDRAVDGHHNPLLDLELEVNWTAPQPRERAREDLRQGRIPARR